MKKILATAMAATLACSVLLTGCKGKEPDTSVPDNTGETNVQVTGDYVLPEYDHCVGMMIETDVHTYKMFFLCAEDDNVVDCGTSEYVPRYDKADYVGKPYEPALKFFFYLIDGQPDQKIVNVSPIIAEDEDVSKYSQVFQRIKDECFPDMPLDPIIESRDFFEQSVIESDASYKGMWKELVDGENNNNPGQGPDNNPPPPQTPTYDTPAMSVEEIIQRKAEGAGDIEVGCDITIDLSKDNVYDMHLLCDGHKITIKGSIDEKKIIKDHFDILVIENASEVDMSQFDVSPDDFTDADFIGRNLSVVKVRNTSYKNVTFPAGLPESQEDKFISPMDDFVTYRISDEGDECIIEYRGPSSTYEERHELEVKIVTAVLTEGDAESVIDSNNPGDVKIWTEVEVDVGEVDLPDQDYQEIQIMPGGKLTIKGTIGVTGGRLNFTVYDTDCLDIRELVLVKKHLTPDMVKIRFERGLEINTDLLQATTDEGEIKFDMAEDSYNITIW